MSDTTTLVGEKLESIRRCLERIQTRCPDRPEQLAEDIDAQDIVSVNLTRAVQLAVDIASHRIAATGQRPPATMGESFDRLAEAGVIETDLARRMKSAVGFRNLSVHSYRKIDWHIVHAIAQRAPTDFREFARAITAAAHTPG